MLHASTQVLTPTGFVSISSLKVNDTLKTYFGTTQINKIEQDHLDLMRIVAGPATLLCSTDQQFLLKSDFGYVFDIPKVGDELVKYAVKESEIDMLMTLECVTEVTLWGKGDFYKLQLDDDFILIVTNYLLART